MAEPSEFDKQVLEEVNALRETYFTFDDPVPFCGVTLYPVRLRDYKTFMYASQCLLLNRRDDVKGIKMSDLEYLLYKIEDKEKGAMYSDMFSKILEICLHIKPGFKCPKCGHYISYVDFFTKYNDMPEEELRGIDIELCEECHKGKYVPSLAQKIDEETKRKYLIIDGHVIKKDEFNRLRKYLLHQNLPDFIDDSWVDKSIRDDQAQRQEIESRGKPTATLEEKIVAVCAASSYTIDKIVDLSMRKFLLLFNSVTGLVEYQANRIGLMSGTVSLKKGETLPHWVFHDERTLYGKAVDAQTLINQIESL